MITKHTPNHTELLSAYCKVQGKYGVYVDLYYDTELETLEFFTARVETDFPLWHEFWDSMSNVYRDAMYQGTVLFLVDTVEEMWSVYRKVRGQDGLPGDSIPGKFYAITFNPDGNFLTENT